MAEVRFHLDEHMPGALARELSRLGMDLETTSEAGLVEATDIQHLVHARRFGLVIVTQDSDYASLHRAGHEHSGVAYFPGHWRSVGVLIESLVLLHASFTAEEMVGRLEYL